MRNHLLEARGASGNAISSSTAATHSSSGRVLAPHSYAMRQPCCAFRAPTLGSAIATSPIAASLTVSALKDTEEEIAAMSWPCGIRGVCRPLGLARASNAGAKAGTRAF